MSSDHCPHCSISTDPPPSPLTSRAEPTAPEFVLHTIFDDSLDGRWQTVLRGRVNVSEEAQDSIGGFCTRSLRLSFERDGGEVSFYSVVPLLGLEEPGISPSISFKMKAIHLAHVFERSRCSSQLRVSSTCQAPICIRVRTASRALLGRSSNQSKEKRRNSTPTPAKSLHESQSLYVQVCPQDFAMHGGWSRMTLPLNLFSTGKQLANGFTSFSFVSSSDESLHLLIDDLCLISHRKPTQIRTPFVTISSPPQDPQNSASLIRSPGWCQYMSSEYRGTRPTVRDAPRCLMNGDHLRGRWIRNCEPTHITRPDVYAYGRPIPRVLGKFDFRICFRSSLWERERSQLALSWTWRPYDCRMASFDAHAFDRWLGRRTIVIIGDSLSAQMYFSLVFMLGTVVVKQIEHTDGLRSPSGNGNTTEMEVPVCSSSAAEEGLSAFSEVQLSQGGRVVKVLGHNRYIQELQHTETAPWARFAREADILIINVGHHYRYVDPGFGNYKSMVRAVERNLREVLKPSAQLLLRTTNLGHRGCENASRPLQDRFAAWSRLSGPNSSPFAWTPPPPGQLLNPSRGNINEAPTNRSDPYDWRAPALHEGEWARVFGESTAFRNRFSVLNVSFVDQRADGHVAHAMRYSLESERKASWGGGLDCLHYCFPGPSDFWVLALYNQLLALPKSEV